MIPFFTVVVPLYNRAHLVGQIYGNLSEQTYRDFEIVIVDDGSTDDPACEIAKLKPGSVTFIQQPNAGASAARNAGILAAKGKYIAFLDSDDLFMPNKLERMAQAIGQSGAEMLFAYSRVDRGGGAYGRKPGRPLNEGEKFENYSLVSREPAQTSSLVIEAEVARYVLFDEQLRKLEDIDFGIRVSQRSERVHFIPEVLSIWTDVSQEKRLGNLRDTSSALHLEAKLATLVSPRALRGFRANLLSYEIGQNRPFLAVRLVAEGLLFGGVPLKRSLHSLARAIIPQSAYRRFVNKVLQKDPAAAIQPR